MRRVSIKAFILDNKIENIETITSSIENDSRIELIGKNTNTKESIEEIKELQPDIVFLGLNMQDLSGNELFKMRDLIFADTEVVLVTQSKELALKSIRYNPFDILLLPVDQEQFEEVVTRLGEKKKKNQKGDATIFSNKLVVKNKGEAYLINYSDIVYLEAEGNYTYLLTQEGKARLISRHLGFVQSKIQSNRFHRINRSYIINIDFISEVSFKKKAVYLKYDENLKELSISRRHLKTFKNLFSY